MRNTVLKGEWSKAVRPYGEEEGRRRRSRTGLRGRMPWLICEVTQKVQAGTPPPAPPVT
jgi:hypothetical protein